MPYNIIVMTAGLAGSSVLTGLIARGGWWCGEQTFRKKDYDTHENLRLIELNEALFDAVGFDGDYTTQFPGWVAEAMAREVGSIDPTPYREFVAECERNGPWVWKDPRLTLTIRAWAQWLDLERVRFVVITRELRQSWISETLRRDIQSVASHACYQRRVAESIRDFFRLNAIEPLEIVYEDLLLDPSGTLARLNAHIGAELDTDDLGAVFHGRLHRRQHGVASLIKANLIYLRNYEQRRRFGRIA